ncbi:chlorophyllase, alpha/beta hydrolase fold protein [Tanacetum coccineum]
MYFPEFYRRAEFFCEQAANCGATNYLQLRLDDGKDPSRSFRPDKSAEILWQFWTSYSLRVSLAQDGSWSKDFGHLDMVDDWLVRLAGMFICKTGKGSKDDMRRACGGIFVAFLKAYMFHNADDLTAIIDSPNSVAPIKLDPVLWLQS